MRSSACGDFVKDEIDNIKGTSILILHSFTHLHTSVLTDVKHDQYIRLDYQTL